MCHILCLSVIAGAGDPYVHIYVFAPKKEMFSVEC